MKARHIVIMIVAAMVGGGITNWLLQEQRAFAASDAIAESVIAKEFRLVDSKGKTKAILGTSKDNPHLVLSDDNGTMRMMLQIDDRDSEPPSSSIRIFDGKGDKEVLRMQMSDGLNGFIAMDEQGKPSIILGLLKDKYKEPQFQMIQDEKHIRAHIQKEGVSFGMSATGEEGTIRLIALKKVTGMFIGDNKKAEVTLGYTGGDCDIMISKNGKKTWGMSTKD